MEELQIIQTTDGRQFEPWVSPTTLQAIVQDANSVTAVTSEMAQAKATIAEAINTKGGSSTSSESFAELAEDIENLASSGVLSNGIVQSQPFRFLDYVCKMGAYPFTEINDDSVTTLSRYYAFSQQPVLLSVTMSALTTISGYFCFSSCTALQSVTMNALTTISGNNIFTGCTALQSVTIPTLTTMSGGGVFENCTALQSVTMSALTTISGTYVFYRCTALQNVTMSALTTISGNNIFRDCSALQNIEFGTLTTINEPFANVKPDLRNITIGQDTNINLPFQMWTATNVIAEGQSGIDELNANLQTNLIAKLYQGGNKVLRLGTALYDVTTQETRDAVTAKGWTLQRG